MARSKRYLITEEFIQFLSDSDLDGIEIGRLTGWSVYERRKALELMRSMGLPDWEKGSANREYTAAEARILMNKGFTILETMRMTKLSRHIVVTARTSKSHENLYYPESKFFGMPNHIKELLKGSWTNGNISAN